MVQVEFEYKTPTETLTVFAHGVVVAPDAYNPHTLVQDLFVEVYRDLDSNALAPFELGDALYEAINERAARGLIGQYLDDVVLSKDGVHEYA